MHADWGDMRYNACRIGDVYPDNMVQVTARMYLYRWNEHTDDNPGNAHYQVSNQEICLQFVRHNVPAVA